MQSKNGTRWFETATIATENGSTITMSRMTYSTVAVPRLRRERCIVASDPDEADEKVKQYVDWGLNHLVFHDPRQDQRRFLELFKTDLEPRLRKLA